MNFTAEPLDLITPDEISELESVTLEDILISLDMRED